MKNLREKIVLFITFLAILLMPALSFAVDKAPSAMVASQILMKARQNSNWKVAFATGRHGQIVFMNVSPSTNPKNEIGMETHAFDQVILVVEGNGKAVLNGKIFMIKAGDMIFIPQGTAHNVINLNHEKPLKIISFYSSNDIPARASYKQKVNEPKG